MQSIGEALHGFFASDRPELGESARLELARGLLRRWGVAEHLTPEQALQASDALRRWADTRYTGASWHRELPMQHRLPVGTVMRGVADLALLRTSDAAIVDHKSYAEARPDAIVKAAAAAAQLRLYADALRAARGFAEISTWVHLPLAGIVVRVEA
jgi:hypothetical protein